MEIKNIQIRNIEKKMDKAQMYRYNMEMKEICEYSGAFLHRDLAEFYGKAASEFEKRAKGF